MKKENLNIEDLFRQSFNGSRIEPSKNLWNKINFRLNLKQFFKADFKTFNVYYSAIIIGLFTSLAIYLSSVSTSENAVNLEVKKEIVIENNHLSNDIKENNNSSVINVNQFNIKSNQKLVENSKAIVSQQILFSTEKDCTAIFPIRNQNYTKLILVDNDSLNHINSIIPDRPKPLFSIDCKEGCIPFELNLKNYTQNAVNFYWSFGDGGVSNKISPSYTYNYPGIYRIQLKVTGFGGIAISIIDSIIVHDKPSIKAFWPYESDFFVGEKIVIPIEAQNAKHFEWNFGDGTLINKKQPEYSYKSTGDYSIVLKSWSDFGCSDSLNIADIKVVKSNKQIVFPTAFYPNQGGPSGGKYSERETYIDIFHPLVKDVVSDYKLIIYSRLGSVVFQSNDIKTGWDGYFEQRLVPEGVYPYVATGKFEGGSSFLRKGNVTILYRK